MNRTMRSRIILFATFLLPLALPAQDRFATRTGHISFYSSTPMEDIEAHNRKVSSVFDAGSSAIEFAVLIKSFEFKKALMQEHFNESYMESNIYPKATFKGRVSGLPNGVIAKPGTYEVTATGDLVIHGVSRTVTVPGRITVNADGTLKLMGTFMVRPEDHGIKVPGMVRDNIAKEIKVTVAMDYQRM
jgi:hypothetical protein